MNAWMMFVLGCAHPTPPQPPVPPAPPVVETPPPPPPGSLWSETDTRYLIGMDGNARRVGDLITVVIVEDAESAVQSDTNTSKQSGMNANIGSLFGLEGGIVAGNGEAALGMEVGSGSSYQGSGTTARTGSLRATLTCQVTQVLPNGNLEIWGTKSVRLNRETQYLVLKGTIRPRDIQLDNTVRSDLIANAMIEYTGNGVVSDKDGPGIGQRVFDRAFPF